MAFRVKEVRMERGLTQEELAEKSGVSRMIISGLETGTLESTTTKTLVALAVALDTTPDKLFFVKGV